ncbi:hypothetical protein FACS1894132_09310 [Clostridia bacterium]|nr:hypothetical protein FACS1894132_09310 [Clostridia bacterium]
MGKFKDALLAIIQALVGQFDNNVATAINVLRIDFNSDPIFSVVYTTCGTIAGVIVPVATSICGLCFLIEFIKISLKMDMLKLETFFACLIKFAIAKASLDIAPTFLLAIYEQGMGIIGNGALSGGSSTFSAIVSANIQTILGGASWYEALAFCATMSIMFVAVMIIGLMIVVMAYGRTFELLLYFAVAPLPAAFLCLENSQITKKFFLNFASVVLQGVLMLIVLGIFNSFVGAILDPTTFTGTTWQQMTAMMGQMLIATITLATVLMKTGSLSKAVLGQA